MPAIEVEGLRQKAVLWAYSAPDSHGDATVAAGIEIRVRWEAGTREAVSDDATPIAINVTAMVDREIAAGSIMRLGELADLPAIPDELVEVVDYQEVPDIKARKFQRTVTLRKWKQHLPEIV